MGGGNFQYVNSNTRSTNGAVLLPTVVIFAIILALAAIAGGAVASEKEDHEEWVDDTSVSDRLTQIDTKIGWETDATAASNGAPGQLSVQNSTVTIANATVNEEAPAGNISVKAQADEPVAGSSTFVEFDPDNVTVDAVVGGAFEDLAYEVDNEAGWLRIETADETALEDPELAEIQFTATMNDGEETTLSLSDDTILWNDQGESSTPFFEHGTITVVADDPITKMAIDDVTVPQSNETHSTSLYATSGEAIAGFQSFVTFDPDAVTIVDVEADDLDTVAYEKDNENGWVNVAGAEAAGLDDPTLATISFETSMEPGEETDLSLGSESVVNDGLGAKLDTQLEDGTISVDSPAVRAASTDVRLQNVDGIWLYQ